MSEGININPCSPNGTARIYVSSYSITSVLQKHLSLLNGKTQKGSPSGLQFLSKIKGLHRNWNCTVCIMQGGIVENRPHCVHKVLNLLQLPFQHIGFSLLVLAHQRSINSHHLGQGRHINKRVV